MAWGHRLLALFGRGRLDRDLDEEVRFHVEMRVRDNLAAGMAPAEARADALRRFGSVPLAKERMREADLPVGLETWLKDLRQAARVLRRSPGFALAVIAIVATAGTRLLRGRGFVEGDDETRAPVGIVNQTMARRFWPGADAVGRRIVLGSHYASPPDDSQGAWVTVVGVVADAKQIRIVEEPVRQEIFFPLRQHAAQGRNMALLLRSGIDPDRLADVVRRAVLTVDPEQPIFAVYTMDQVIADSFGAKRLATLLLGLFALVAAALASVGLYAVLAYAVAQRRHEIGVRMALGARRADILRMVLREGSRLALAGVAAGLAGALLATRLLAGMLFAVAPTDPATFAAVSALLAAVALLASYLPARRATAVDPAAAFQQE
jgi:putative ABC transport system permease protein